MVQRVEVPESDVQRRELLNRRVRLLLSDGRNPNNITNWTHGRSGTPEYQAWSDIKRRCHNPNEKRYAKYGGRGIKVCKRWRESFLNFFEDMGIRPQGKSIDRINNDGDYEPSNCRWATRIEQSNNRTNTRKLEYNGETKTAAQWDRTMGLGAGTIFKRIKYRGWTVDAAISTPQLR